MLIKHIIHTIKEKKTIIIFYTIIIKSFKIAGISRVRISSSAPFNIQHVHYNGCNEPKVRILPLTGCVRRD